MIKILVNGVLGFAIHPNVGVEEQAKILAAMPASSSVGFIDVAPTRDVMGFIGKLEAGGHQLASYADHHLDPRRPAEVANVRMLESKLGQRAVIVNRDRASSCIRLVEAGEWSSNGIMVVMFHADFDGFLGFLKGCGVSYPEMEQDADILDGGLRGVPVSSVGKLLADAHENLVPAFSQDPAGHQAVKVRVYQTVADWVVGGCQLDTIAGFVAEVAQATEAAESAAFEIAVGAQLLPGRVVFADALPYIKAGRNVAFPLLKQELLRRFGPALMATTGTGHMGEQMYIELPKAWQHRYDLRDYLPRGVVGRMPFRVQVPLKRWEEFLENWRCVGQ